MKNIIELFNIGTSKINISYVGLKKKTMTMCCLWDLSSNTNTSGSLGEREMLWEHEPQESVSTPQEKEKQLVNFDYQNVSSLCLRQHYVNSAR